MAARSIACRVVVSSRTRLASRLALAATERDDSRVPRSQFPLAALALLASAHRTVQDHVASRSGCYHPVGARDPSLRRAGLLEVVGLNTRAMWRASASGILAIMAEACFQIG